MVLIGRGRKEAIWLFLANLLLLTFSVSAIAQDEAALRQIEVHPGVVLNYTDEGSGPAIVFVHGSSGDYRSWSAQTERLSDYYRVVTYSRRYNYPNKNAAVDGYSARVDAEDLAALIDGLNLQEVYIVGHSYGAFTTLFLLSEHPGLVRAAVLAEPPAISLLREYPPSVLVGRAMEWDIQAKLTAPMTAAFRAGDHEGGMRAFYDYVAGPGLYALLPEEVRRQGLENADEWQIMLTRGEFFPEIDRGRIGQIEIPILLLAGSETNPFLMMIHETLAALLPMHEQVVIEGASHPMFATHPTQAEDAVLDFFSRHPAEN